MPKIKCPHCGANNQDVTEKDKCWQCDAVLGAPVAVADPAAPTVPVPSPAQKQIEPTASKPLPTVSSPQGRFPTAPIAIVIVLLLIVLAIVFLMLKK